MARLIGIDLSTSPAHGAIMEVPAPGSPDFPRCVAAFTLLPQNHDKNDQQGPSSTNPNPASSSAKSPISTERLVAGELDFNSLQSEVLVSDGSAAVIAPPLSMGMYVTLPFSDAKRVNALLPQELEDLLPFPSSEFTIGLSATGTSPLANGGYTFHVQLAPKTSVKEALEDLSLVGIDPAVLAPRSALLAPVARSLLNRAPTVAIINEEPINQESNSDQIHLDSFFILHPISMTEADILFCIDRRIVSHQTIHSLHTQSGSSLNSALLLEVGNIARRFQREVLSGFLLTTQALEVEDQQRIQSITNELIANSAPLKLELLDLASLVPGANTSNARAVLIALCANGASSAESFPEAINFRRGEFSYRPPLGEMLRAGKRLIRPLLLTLGCGLICAISVYLFRAQEIAHLQRGIAESIQSIAPQLRPEEGQELIALANEADRMETELKDIGTSDSSSPLELYAELTKHFPQLPDTTVDRVAIRGSRIEVRGCAPSYRVIEQIENALEKVKMFASVKKGSAAQGCPSSPGAGGSSARGFTFEVTSRD